MGHEYYVSVSQKGALDLFNAKGILINSFNGDNDGFDKCMSKEKVEELLRIHKCDSVEEIATLKPKEFQIYADKNIEEALNEAFGIGTQLNPTKDYNALRKQLTEVFDNFIFGECGDESSGATITEGGIISVGCDFEIEADGVFVSILNNKFGDGAVKRANNGDIEMVNKILDYITNELYSTIQEDVTKDFYVSHYYGE